MRREVSHELRAPAALPFPLEPGETVLLLTRRHWLAFWPRFILLLLTIALPLGFALGLLARRSAAGSGTWRFLAGAAVLWGGFWLVRAVLLKYRYDRDIWVITNQRVVDAVTPAPFHFSMSTAGLSQIQDISTRIDGPAATLFGYGDIECQTAGEARHFRFRQVPHPREIATLLQQECLRARGDPRDHRSTERL